MWITYKVTKEDEGLTVQEFIRTRCQISARDYQRLMRSKQILVRKKTPYSKALVREGQLFHIKKQEDRSYGVVPEHKPISILYEDDRVLIVNKPPFIAVHPMGQTKNHTLSHYVAAHYEKNKQCTTVRPLHRLDRNTSGCVLFAKTKEVQHQLTKQLENKQCKRIYVAIVEGIPPQATGSFIQPIAIDPSSPNRRCVSPEGDYARTDYTVLCTGPHHALVKFVLHTGRTHQIRVHTSHAGYPILGDAMYGQPSSLIKRQALHGISLHWQEEKIEKQVSAPLPQDMLQACRHLGLDIKK